MKDLTCIVCPVGCLLSVEENGGELYVTGNKCARGVTYAQEEVRAPKRIVTATCQILYPADTLCEAEKLNAGSVRRVPVKTVTPCLRKNIPALLEDIYLLKISLPVKTGDVVIADWNGEGIDVVATRTVG
jgi:CxxC motif-containing protein